MLQNKFDMTNARTFSSLFPVQVLMNRYCNVNVNVVDDDDETFSVLYRDLYLKQLKETLKQTMLVHESVFESQIRELHRLYQRQKELMMEMEETRKHEALCLKSSFHTHWMSSSVSIYENRRCAYEENIPNLVEVVDSVEKFEKKVLDLELPVFEYNDREEEQSLRRMSLESGNQSNKLGFDLNEPAKIEEHSVNVFCQFLSPVISNGLGEESNKENEGEATVKGSHSKGQSSSVMCRGEYGIDLNIYPLSSEAEVTGVNNFETKKPQDSLSVSLYGKHGSEQSRVVVQALPCLNSVLLLDKRYISPMRGGSRPRKKVKLASSNKNFLNLDPPLRAQDISKSQNKQASMEKGSSSSLSEVKSARNRTNLGKRRRSCKPQMKSSNGHKVVAKKKRKQSRRISLVTEGNYLERSAAEAIVEMSRKSGEETEEYIGPLGRNLLWLAEISLIFEDNKLDDFEAMALQPTEMKQDQKTILRSNSADNKPAVISSVFRKQRRSRAKRKCKDDQHNGHPRLTTLSEGEADEDPQVIEKLVEVSESKWDCELPKNKSQSSPPKPLEASTSSVEEKTVVEWRAIKKRRRGSRIPAADFQHMIINQVV